MGYDASAKKPGGIKYLMTQAGEPFCSYPYLVEITVSALVNKTAGEIAFVFINGQQNATFSVTKY